jgi:2-phosphosulfolactate phosphatase
MTSKSGRAARDSQADHPGSDPWDQAGYPCRLEWGRRGARAAAARGDVLVVVDTLSFSTAVATATHHGARIYPCHQDEDPAALAWRAGAVVSVHRGEAPARGRFSLSPLSFLDVADGTRIVLPSPNGATCCALAGQARAVVAGALINAAAAARAARSLAGDAGITVIACGERWIAESEEGVLRFAIEDYLGAGAILAELSLDKSPEAIVCAAAFRGARRRLDKLIQESGSGRELCNKGYGGDVIHAAQLNRYDSAPVLYDGSFVRFETVRPV